MGIDCMKDKTFLMVLMLFSDVMKNNRDLFLVLDDLFIHQYIDDIIIQHVYELKSLDMRTKVKYIARFLKIHEIVIKFSKYYCRKIKL